MEEFSQAFDLMLKEISYIVHELNLDGLCTSISKESVEIAREVIHDYDMTYVMNSLVMNHMFWNQVISKDNKFITELFIPIIKSNAVPIDTDIIAVVFIYHEKIKISTKYAEISDVEKPVNESDLDILWQYMIQMIRSVIRWIIQQRSQSNVDFHIQIDIEMYVRMFS